MKDDLVEQCAAAVHFCRDDADAHEIANAVLAIACPAILAEAAKVARECFDDPQAEADADYIPSAISALAHTTGQEGGR